MNQEQWDSLQAGSIIRNIKSKRLRKVLCVKNKSITLCKVSGRGTTVYCNGDKYLWEPTGFKIKEKNMADRFTNKYISVFFSEKNELFVQLTQLLQITFDGDIINKETRDLLVKAGYANRVNGFNIISTEGISFLIKMQIISA